MTFQYVGHLAFENAEVKYRTVAGTEYELPATYQGAYPGATRDSQTLETDSVAITIAGTPTPQQMSVQLPASDHPAAKDMFAAQTDGSPRRISVELKERILFEISGPTTTKGAAAVAGGVVTLTGTEVIANSKLISPEVFPINAVIKAGTNELLIVNEHDDNDKLMVEPQDNLAAAAISKTSAPGLRFGPFLANVDEIGLIEDTGVAIYRFAFTPVNVVAAPTRVVA